MKKIYPLFLLFFCFINLANSQTNPAPQTLPFTFTALTGSTLPAGMAVHRFGTSAGAIPTTRILTPGNADLPYNSGGTSGGWRDEAANGLSMLASGTQSAGALIVSINTTGLTNVQVGWTVRTILQQASRDNSIALQYRLGQSGNFIDVGTTSTYSSTGQAAGHSLAYSETLPAAAENQPEVQVRWIYWESGGASGSRDRLAVDEISISGTGGPSLPSATVTATGVPAEPATNGSFTVSLSSPAPVGGLTINYTAGGTATAGTDYTALGGSVFIAEGNSSSPINISVADDALIDPDETIIVTLTSGSGYSLGLPFTSTLSITDNEITNLFSYDFNTCAGLPVNGFTQFSVTGPQVWGCTTFGRDANNPPSGSAPNGLQMNGFDNTIPSNVLNEDWLISPSYDLTATTYPLLSFWSRTRFNGGPLQLKISTDYVSGNPNTGTWTDVNGRFPAQTSDVWTLSSYINLTAFKAANVHFAFVYTSTNDDGARWTLDDIRLDNAAVPPPASLTVSTNDIQFGFAAAGNNVTKIFAVTGNDITGDIILTTGSVFSLSTDGTTFTPSITLTQATANNVTTTIYTRYTPSANNQNNTGTITITTPGVPNTLVNLNGTSIDTANTLEVVNWNVEWFGSTTLGPANDAQQQANILTIMQATRADLYALVEVVDEARLASVVSSMPGYAYVICNYGSHTNPNAPSPSPLSEAQKEAFVYKTSVFSNITAEPLLSQGINSAADITNPAYNYFASGRFPYMMTADVTLNGVTKTIRFVLLHAKANTSPTATSYARRKAGSDTLQYTLNNLYPNDLVVLLGDINDDLDQTITDGIVPPTTSYSAFTNDVTNFYSPTLPLSLAGKKSTVSFNDMIDHVIVSTEMKGYYMGSTASVLSDVSSLVASYGSTTTDHYPVFTRYAFDPIILPVELTRFTAEKENSRVKISWITQQENNSREFRVQRSAEGRNWTTVATVPAAGNSNAAIEYSVYDNSPAKGANLYRLQMVDADGKSKLSDTRLVRFDDAGTVILYPNPVKDKLYILTATSKAQIQVTDITGKLVYQTGRSNTATTIIPADALAPGVYVVKIKEAGNTITRKIIKQ